jgi:hypothetical protein
MAGFAEEFFEELESELRSVVRRYKTRIREAYKEAGPDPQAVDGALDSIVASVIKELEDAGYSFDTASLDNVLYNLGRRIVADESGWEVEVKL